MDDLLAILDRDVEDAPCCSSSAPPQNRGFAGAELAVHGSASPGAGAVAAAGFAAPPVQFRGSAPISSWSTGGSPCPDRMTGQVIANARAAFEGGFLPARPGSQVSYL